MKLERSVGYAKNKIRLGIWGIIKKTQFFTNLFKDLLNIDNLEYASSEIFKSARSKLDKKLLTLEDSIDAIKILLAGRCLTCKSCTKEKQHPCIYPEKMHFSLESIGFDVASICEEVLGDKMQWAKEGLPKYYILVSGILSNEELDIKDIYNALN